MQGDIKIRCRSILIQICEAEGLSENVLDTIAGFVVPKRNPELLAAKIMEVLSFTKDKKNNIKGNAVACVKTHFNIQQQREAFLKFYS